MKDPLFEPLERLYHTFDYKQRLPEDPLAFVHRGETPEDQEIIGILASSLAYGRVSLFKPKIESLLSMMAPYGGPRSFIERFNPALPPPSLLEFKYRLTPSEDIQRLFATLQTLLRRYGTLEKAFAHGFSKRHDHIGPALTQFVDEIYRIGPPPTRSFRHLLSSPERKSACKRLNLYLRWMVRRQPGMDLGIWASIPASHLILPLDTHTLRLSQNLGLTSRRDSSWTTAEEITRRLRALDAKDPVKYDFALCHLGMTGNCPASINVHHCRICEVARHCVNRQTPGSGAGRMG